MVVADDFTGALDTGIQFSKANVAAQVVADCQSNYEGLLKATDGTTQVLIVNAQSRHLLAEEAAERISDIVKRAQALHPEYIYKKTDSGLRGNIGAEIEAMMRASGQSVACFAPAFPKTGRITVGGVQYVNGVPVAQTVFGKDPFEPVQHSLVSEIIAEQSALKVTPLGSFGMPPQGERKAGIYLFDACTDEDLQTIAQNIYAADIKAFAGCAGLAEYIPDAFRLPRTSRLCPALPQKMIIISGSLNPITLAQMRYARNQGICGVTLSDEQKYTPNYAQTAAGKRFLQALTRKAQTCEVLLVEAADSNAPEDEICENAGARQTVSENMGDLSNALIQNVPDALYVFVGGDTLMAAMSCAGCTVMEPIDEVAPGVVLSKATGKGIGAYVVSKSGGFGEENVVAQIRRYLELHAVSES